MEPFLLPILLFTFVNLIISTQKYYPIVPIVLIFILLISNIILIPLHVEGTRLPNWGSPLVDTAEYTYPYDKAVQWLSMQDDINHLLSMGYYYPYHGFKIYFNKYNFYPDMIPLRFGTDRFDELKELTLLHSFFNNYNKIKNNNENTNNIFKKRLLSVDTILYHSVNNIKLDNDFLYGNTFRVGKKISNSEHTLYILRKKGF